MNYNKYLYCDFSVFAYNQTLSCVDIPNKRIVTIGHYETPHIAEAICKAAQKDNIELVILDGNAAYLKKIVEKIHYINTNLKVEVNPYS